MSATDLSVGECLRQADQEIRSLTFDVGQVRVDELLTAMGPFLTAAARVLSGLSPTDSATGVIATEASRWRFTPKPGATADLRMSAATDLLDRAGDLIERYGSPVAPDRVPVASYVQATVGIAAHVVSRVCRDHLAGSRARGRGRPGVAPGTATGINSSTIESRLRRAERVEDFALMAVQSAGRPTWSATTPSSEGRVQAALARWTTATDRCLQSGRASVDDLRWIAAMNGQLEIHSLVLLAAAKVSGVVTSDQVGGLPAALRSAAKAWGEAGEQWPAAMFGPERRAGAELLAARQALNQTLQAVTRPDGNHWATPHDIAARHDAGILLDHVAVAGRDLSHIAKEYEVVALTLLRSGQVKVPGRSAYEYTGRVSNAAWVTVPREYAERTSFGNGRLTAAAEAARIGLDTATVMTAQTQQARARLPLSMAGVDIDKAIRERVKALTTTSKSRVDALTAQLDQRAGGRNVRDDDPRPHQAPRHDGPRAR